MPFGLLADVSNALESGLGSLPLLGPVVTGLSDLLGSGEGSLVPVPGGLADGLG